MPVASEGSWNIMFSVCFSNNWGQGREGGPQTEPGRVEDRPLVVRANGADVLNLALVQTAILIGWENSLCEFHLSHT